MFITQPEICLIHPPCAVTFPWWGDCVPQWPE